MMAVVTGRSAAEIAVLVAATLTALGVIVRFVSRWVRKCIHFFQRIEKALVNVESQLYPNGGASLRDAVNRLQAAVGVQDIPAKTSPIHNASGVPDPQPPSVVLGHIDALETRTEAMTQTAAIIDAVNDAADKLPPKPTNP